MDICLDNNMVFIYIGGVSSSDPDFTKQYKSGDKDYIFESVSYKSSKLPNYVLDDIITGRGDTQLLSVGEIPQPTSERKILRLNNLVNIIIFYMRYTNRKIIIMGISHGSVIVHTAILKIKGLYEPVNDLMNIFKERIIILTLGSPKYLPKTLLTSNHNVVKDDEAMNVGNVYNFYNAKDQIYLILSSIRYLGINTLTYLKFPALSIESNSTLNDFTNISESDKYISGTQRKLPKYKFDSTEHIFIVKNTENLKYTMDLNDHLLIQNLCKSSPSLIFFHSVLFHFFPVFLNNLHIIHYMRNIISTDISPGDTNGRLIKIVNRSVFANRLLDGGRKIRKIRKIKKYLKKNKLMKSNIIF